MSLNVQFECDWSHCFPFRLIALESEHDAALGQWSAVVCLLGLGLRLVWEYSDTPLKAELRGMMANDDWLKNSHVYMPHDDYKSMKDKADKWDESQGGTA